MRSDILFLSASVISAFALASAGLSVDDWQVLIIQLAYTAAYILKD